MPDEQFVCCRCGDAEIELWWSSSQSLSKTYRLCLECANAVLLIWVIEHEARIEECLTRKAATHGNTGPA